MRKQGKSRDKADASLKTIVKWMDTRSEVNLIKTINGK